MADSLFVPPAAEALPAGLLDSATRGAAALDAFANTPYGRNLLAHALIGMQRDGWLRDEPEAPEPPRGLSAPYCGAYMTEWVCTLPPGRHPGWRHMDSDGNWWSQTRCPNCHTEPVYRHPANGCPEGPQLTEETVS